MKIATSFLSALFVVGALGVSGTPATADVLSKVELEPGVEYCHMKFPAIRESTVNGNHPVLKDANASEGDIIDYYGPCDHDPLAREEIQIQKDRDVQTPELW